MLYKFTISGGIEMWNVVKMENGVEVEDYGNIAASNIRELVNKLKRRFGVNTFTYEKWEHMKSPTYNIYEPGNDRTWLVASKWN